MGSQADNKLTEKTVRDKLGAAAKRLDDDEIMSLEDEAHALAEEEKMSFDEALKIVSGYRDSPYVK